MTVSANGNTLDLGGNIVVTSSIAVGADTSGKQGQTVAPQIYSGAGAPSFAATQGSLYLNTTGSSTSTRLYVNTTGSTTWTNFTSGA